MAEEGLYFQSCSWNRWGVIPNDELKFFDGDHHYKYNLFHRLMDKLVGVGSGFWHNRDHLLASADDMTIVLDKATKDIVGFYVIRSLKDGKPDIVDFFQSFQCDKGIGREMVQHELARRPLCVIEPLPGTEGFWKAVGVPLNRE